MNLAYKYPIIFWNCACLITDSGGGNEDIESGSNDYKKLAIAIGKMRQAGVIVQPPNINTSRYTFYPDVANNKIFFGLSGILNVGDEIISSIIKNRPYHSVKDFIEKVKPKKQAMMSLIKGGAFDEMEDRKFLMAWYIWQTCEPKSKLTLQNMPSLIKYNLLPQETEEQKIAYSIYEFNRYLKSECKVNGETYKIDDRALSFIIKMGYESLIINDNFLIRTKAWDKIYQKHMDVFRNWLSKEKETVLKKLNNQLFLQDWNKYAKGTLSTWEMEVLCFYYHEHEMAHTNQEKYGCYDFFKLPEEPLIDRVFYKGEKEIKLFKLNKICGTCIAKNKNKSTVTLLTTTGVVTVKFRKEYFSLFDKQISVKDVDGTKKIVERSWFNRGNMIVVQGIRSGDNFIAKKYSSTPGHTLYKVTKLLDNGDMVLQDTRYQGELEEEENV